MTNFRTRHDRRRGAGALACAIALLAAADLAIAQRPAAGAAKAPDIGRELRQLVALPGGPPGVIATVQRGRSTAVYNGGTSDLSTHAPVNPDQYVRIASVSKAFTGAVALSLVNRHVLSLSDTIGKWLPKLPVAWRAVTLRTTLNHTSGLPDFSETKAFRNYLIAHLHATPSPMFILDLIKDLKLEFNPGTRYRYSNTDNFVVALMAEAAAHRSYNKLLASTVYSRLHMSHTSLPAGSEIGSPYMHGYDLDPPHPPGDVSTLVSAAFSWASGGMISTIADLNHFIRGYASGRLFSRKVQSQQQRVVRGSSGPPGPGENFAGLAIYRYRTRCGTVYGHTGNTAGYTLFMASTLDGKRSVVFAVNAQINDKSPQPMLAAYHRLRQIEEDAVCTALR